MNFKVKDHYYNKAKKDNYLARSIYKLEEIDTKYKIFKKSDHVIDLGYHPGSWIQYSLKQVGEKGYVLGIDIRPLNKKLAGEKNLRLLEMDAFDLIGLESLGVEKQFDVIISDMAPNTTGIKSVDQARSLALVEKVFEVMPFFLKKNGNFVIKVFDSHDAQAFLKKQKKLFKDFDLLKPKSTRSISKEFFAIGRGYCGEL